jgi:pimeloyl-ACP methyl ester carboxylesterase
MQTGESTATEAPSQNSSSLHLRPIPMPRWQYNVFHLASVLAPGVAIMIARRLFFTPQVTPVRDEERAVLDRAEPFALDVDGKHVAGYAWGAGPAVLLAHGWSGHAGQMTPLVDPLMAAGFRAVAIDMPGHGASAKHLTSLVHFSDAIEAAAARFGPLHGIVAHSFGASACMLSLTRGLTVDRAVFFAPPARFDTWWLRFRMGLGMSDAMWQRFLRDADTWLSVQFEDIAPADLAPGMTVPLLVIHAANDGEVSIDEGAELASRWPGATLHRMERLGHLRLLRNERSIADAVSFLASDRTQH